MFRIKEYPKGFVVEIKKKKFFGGSKWVHFISVAGIDSQPWYHKTYDYAMMNLLDEIKYKVIINSDFDIKKSSS